LEVEWEELSEAQWVVPSEESWEEAWEAQWVVPSLSLAQASSETLSSRACNRKSAFLRVLHSSSKPPDKRCSQYSTRREAGTPHNSRVECFLESSVGFPEYPKWADAF